MRPRSFPPRYRLRRPADFERVYAVRCASRGRRLTVFAAANDLGYSRIGLSVSRRHGGAVVRNRLKRMLREAARLSRRELPPGVDLVLIPVPGAASTVAEYREALVKASRSLASRLASRADPVALKTNAPQPGPP
jgi:ribonuclease P protein component